MTILFELLLFFTDYHIAFFSLSDIALIILLFMAISLGYKVCVQKRHIIFVALMLLGCTISFFVGVTSTYFSIIEYLKSFGKLLLYLLSIFVLPKYLSNRKVDIIIIARMFLYISVLSGCLQLMIVARFGLDSWPLYSLGSQFFGINGNDSMLVNNGLVRARSFFSEPAAFAIAISLVFIILLYRGDGSCRSRIIDIAIYFVGIKIASSVSGYSMAALILAIYYFDIKNIKLFKRMLMLIVPAGIATIMFVTGNSYILGRIENLFLLKDHSGVVRTFGSIIYLKYVPFWGVGLGNSVNYYNELAQEIKDSPWFSGTGEFYNIFVVAVVSMGYIGTTGLVLLLYDALRSRKRAFFSLCVVFFSTGRLFTPSIWFFLIVFMAIEHSRKEERLVGKTYVTPSCLQCETEMGLL